MDCYKDRFTIFFHFTYLQEILQMLTEYKRYTKEGMLLYVTYHAAYIHVIYLLPKIHYYGNRKLGNEKVSSMQ
jgi:hypothetical protein